MKCPSCGAGELVREVRDLPYSYKGRETVIPQVAADWCDACGESLTGPGETGRVMAAMEAHQKAVNASLADPAFVRRVRKRLGLNQQEAGRVFGGGVTAFSRYESGKVEPPVSLVKLLRVLDKHPELLDEVRAG